MAKNVRPQDPDQLLLLVPGLEACMPDDHQARLGGNVVDSLDPTLVEVTYTVGAEQ
jgi:hypothetical protein